MNIMGKKNIGLDIEEIARREERLLTSPQTVKVKINVSWVNGMCLPDSDGKDKEEAVFKMFTFGDNQIIDRAVTYEVVIEESRSKVSVSDLNEYRRFLIKRNLMSWTLDIPIERENGWMTPECYSRVKNIPAPLMEAFLDGFENRISVSREEEEKIVRQSVLLFSKNSRGVADACEAISMFCTLGNLWEKFGIGRGVPLMDMSYKEYLSLKIIMGKETEASRVSHASKKPLTKIVGAGGKPRASQGIVMEGM